MAVKAYAFYALRFVGLPVVDSLYRQALVTEHDPEILTNVLNALFLRSYDAALVKALYKLVEGSDAEQIQLAALQVLFEWSYRQPDLLLTIKEIAGKSSNNAVIKLPANFLHGQTINSIYLCGLVRHIVFVHGLLIQLGRIQVNDMLFLLALAHGHIQQFHTERECHTEVDIVLQVEVMGFF